MAKTTYLLGAGASAGSLPTVDGFEKKLIILIRLFKQYRKLLESNTSASRTEKGHFNIAIRDLAFLLKGCLNHRSIDTFAKMLFITDDKANYNRVKCATILFFELCHFYFQQTDKRYDAFLATILEKNGNDLSAPPNINILSWNYDYEFERAYMKYCNGTSDINNISEFLNILHKNRKSNKDISNKFGIIKINGTAGFYYKNDGDDYDRIILGLGIYNKKSSKKLKHDSLQESFAKQVSHEEVYPLLEKYREFTYKDASKYRPAISFAWEKGDEYAAIQNNIVKALDGIRNEDNVLVDYTDRLIIIGYSFPYFNREVDKKIMAGLHGLNKAKIYIQDTTERATDIIENVKELHNFPNIRYQKEGVEYHTGTQFYPKTDLTQFYMPGD